MPERMRGLAVLTAVMILAMAVLLIAAPVQTAEQKAPEPRKTDAPATATADQPASTPSGPAVIPVTEVAKQATEVSNLLRTLMDKSARSPAITEIWKSLPDVMAHTDRELEETLRLLQRQMALPKLQAQQHQWEQRKIRYAGWLAALTKRSNEHQENLNRLENLKTTWIMTFDAAKALSAPGFILQHISDTIESISAAEVSVRERLTVVLDLQGRVGNEVARCETVLAKIARMQETSMSGILVQDSVPIVSPELWTDAAKAMPSYVRTTASSFWGDINNYVMYPSRRMSLHAGIFAVLTILFFSARYWVRRRTAAGETLSPVVRVFDHPFAAALAMTLFIVASPAWLSMPAAIRDTFQVFAFVPMIILIRPVVSTVLAYGLFALGLLFAVDAMREIFSGQQLIGQGALILESSAAMAVMIWFLRNLRPAFGDATGSSRLLLLQSGGVVILLILAAGFAAAATGYVRLAGLMTPGVLAGGVLAIAVYASLRVVIALVAISLRIWPLRTLQMIQHHRDLLESRICRILIWSAIAGWTIRYLSYIGLLEPFLSFWKAVLTAKFERGPISISPGDVLEFFLTVWVGYLLSAFIRFVLREDVYPRIGITPGKSYALSSLLHYFLIALGFVVGMAVLGINLTKLTVLTGALGVGIGFGLQSVVNNFVSGLILLLERPIKVGDTVEVGDLLGAVRRIGIRASTVRTLQGADIIVPNAQLVTEKVTNWTLGDQLRRIDLSVGVSYSSAPKEVIQVLEKVAIDHPHILASPPPQALFTGYGDSSIDFELRAWTDRFEDWARIRSELATAVFDAVRAAGMSFPFPQREVRLLRDAESAKAAAHGQPEAGKG